MALPDNGQNYFQYESMGQSTIPATTPVTTPMTTPTVASSPFYQKQSFDKEALFRQKYGTNASNRDRRRFERYWNSDQRLQDWAAFEEAESNKYLQSVDNYIQQSKNRLNGVTVPAPEPTAPEFYQQQDFRTAKLAEMYGSDPSKRDLRRFNKYINSDQGRADWEAFEAAESNKYLQSVDDRMNFYRNKHAAAAAAMNTTPAPTLVPRSEVAPAPVAPAVAPAATPAPDPAAVTPASGTPAAQPAAVQPASQGASIEDQINAATSFNSAFGIARKAGLSVFNWKGKKYGTKLKGETGTAAKPANAAVRAATPTTTTQAMIQNRVKKTDTGAYDWEVMSDKNGGALITKHLQGGTVNRINYFQQGGAAPQQDIQQLVIQLVQAAMSGDEKATQTVNQIMEAAKAGDQQAAQIAQMIQQVAQQMQGQATAAKWGAKLGYIRSLKFANGGKTCPACQQGTTIKKPKTFTLPNKKVEEKACGGKTKVKKRYFGGWIDDPRLITTTESRGEYRKPAKVEIVNEPLLGQKNSPRRVIHPSLAPTMEPDTLYFKDAAEQYNARVGSVVLPEHILKYGSKSPNKRYFDQMLNRK